MRQREKNFVIQRNTRVGSGGQFTSNRLSNDLIHCNLSLLKNLARIHSYSIEQVAPVEEHGLILHFNFLVLQQDGGDAHLEGAREEKKLKGYGSCHPVESQVGWKDNPCEVREGWKKIHVTTGSSFHLIIIVNYNHCSPCDC